MLGIPLDAELNVGRKPRSRARWSTQEVSLRYPDRAAAVARQFDDTDAASGEQPIQRFSSDAEVTAAFPGAAFPGPGFEDQRVGDNGNKRDLTTVRPPGPPPAPPSRPASSPRPNSSTRPVSLPRRPSAPPSPRVTLQSATQPSLGAPPPGSTQRPIHADMTTVRPMSAPPSSIHPHQDMTRVRPPGMEMAAPSLRPQMHGIHAPTSSPRVSVPAPGEIHRRVRRKQGGLLALYWAAGIVAMLTAGGIVIAMIARGDADALIQRQGAPAASIVVVPNANVATPATPVNEIPQVAPIVGAQVGLPAPPTPSTESRVGLIPSPPSGGGSVPVAGAPKEVAPRKSTGTSSGSSQNNTAAGGNAIPGLKPGQIVDLQLWRNRPSKDGASPGAASGGSSAPAAAGSPAPMTPATKSTVSTPDNDPAVRLARDQLESSFK